MTRALIAGGIALALMGLAVHNPNLRTIQRRIIALRAAWMLVPRLWESAADRARRDWPEMLRRATIDVHEEGR